MDEPKGRSLRCVQLPVQLQVDPESHPRLGIAQLDLGRLHARRREADDNMGPPVIDDGVSDQHFRSSPLPETSPSAWRARSRRQPIKGMDRSLTSLEHFLGRQ
jgi:hypothetical protein